MNKDKEQI